MAASIYNILCDQGETYEQSLIYQNSDGTAVDITGATARMMVRTDYAATTTVVSLTEVAGITLGGAAGTIDLTITDTQTAALAAGKYVYDLELIMGSKVKKLIRGDFIVRAEVTK